jgi:hypothetical protein
MSKEFPQDWAESAKGIHLFRDRLIRAGWAQSLVYDDKGMAVAWTDDGIEKMRQLWCLYRELGATSFTPQDLTSLLHILMLAAAEHQDW